jgi:hypothetical protein
MVVFVGFSLSDVDFMETPRYLGAIFERGSVRHYAILPYPRNPALERQKLRTRYNLEAVFYLVGPGQDHSQRGVLLHRLLDNVNVASTP